jgi:uncharacterized membrane protein
LVGTAITNAKYVGLTLTSISEGSFGRANFKIRDLLEGGFELW